MKTKLLFLTAWLTAATAALQAQQYTKYLFAYFPSNDNENIYYALSTADDPFRFVPMNDGNRVIAADTIALKKGVRDPHVLRGNDGWFYMVNTDMRCAEGWSSNRGMVLMRSRDLVSWQHATVNFPEKYRGTSFANVTRVWAPETIWDPKAGKYMVYFSLLTDDGTIPYDKVFYCYANDDFTDLEGEPQYLYDRGSATIDMDIVFNPKDQLYHAFYKNEGEGGICKVTARSLTPDEGQQPGQQWSEPSGTLQQTRVAVEGAGIWPLINGDGSCESPEKWILMYDCYGSGYYQFCESSDLQTFTLRAQTNTSGMFTPRHGTVLPVTDEEASRIEQRLAEQRRPQYREQLRSAIESARQLGIDVTEAAQLLGRDDAAAAELKSSAEALRLREHAHVAASYPHDASQLLGAWTRDNVTTTQKGQHWNGTPTSYYSEQRTGWAKTAWSMAATQTVRLPAGNYVLKVACRASSEAVTARVTAGALSADFPTKGDTGTGIATDGQARFDPSAAYANDGRGRGWEWRFVPISLKEEADVELAVTGSVTDAQHQWLSFTSISLLAQAPTGLGEVRTPPAQPGDERLYTLGGRCLQSPLMAGIAVQGGRKILVK